MNYPFPYPNINNYQLIQEINKLKEKIIYLENKINYLEKNNKNYLEKDDNYYMI